MNNINAINLVQHESESCSGALLCGGVHGMGVLCHFVLDNERIHYRLLHIIQTGREGALRSLREQIKELDLKLGKVIGMFKYCPKFRYLQAFIQSDSAGNSVRKKLLLGKLSAYYLSCCLCHNSWFYQLKKKNRAIQENITPETAFLALFFFFLMAANSETQRK